MSGGGSRETVNTSVQNNDPWGASQPYLRDAMGRASDMLESGEGFNPYQGSTAIPYSRTTREGMRGVLDTARQGVPGTNTALQNAQSVLRGGGAMAPIMDVATGQNAITAGQYYEPIASGQELEQGNPYLMQALESGADEIQNRVGNETAAFGRSGSGAMAGRLADSLGDYYSGALASDYNNMRNRQMQAISGLAGTQGANIANQVGAAQGALQSGLSYGAQVPGLESARYDPYARMMSIGGMEEDLATRQKLDEVRRFEGSQQADWTRLANAMGIFSGAGALGGQSSATQYVQQPRPNPWTQAAGLGLTAAGLFGGF